MIVDNSFEVQKFAKDWNFKITMSSMNYAQPIGQSERCDGSTTKTQIKNITSSGYGDNSQAHMLITTTDICSTFAKHN
ncbi:hypothetical protein RRG08_056270 [Elysia crispata]|uniref:Uncharacterized protein n=1 Tax=Elysia crispata TaxID=231223 RepID=A0AAE1AYG9_9GAST|nr:hypothetical protein RRG08_056270 [Elysia crispata]